MRMKNIVITEPDNERLQRLIDSLRHFRQRDTEYLDALEEELERAVIVKAADVPRNVVTMNSRVRVKDLKDGRELTYEIVLPRNADPANNRISVLAPIGTALLGYGAGTKVEWRVPSGIRRLRILDVEQHAGVAEPAA